MLRIGFLKEFIWLFHVLSPIKYMQTFSRRKILTLLFFFVFFGTFDRSCHPPPATIIGIERCSVATVMLHCVFVESLCREAILQREGLNKRARGREGGGARKGMWLREGKAWEIKLRHRRERQTVSALVCHLYDRPVRVKLNSGVVWFWKKPFPPLGLQNLP